MKQYALNTEKLVVLGNSLTPCGGTRLDLADTEGNDEVRNERVLGLTATVRDHDSPVIGLRELGTVGRMSVVVTRIVTPNLRLNGLGDGTNLVDLQEHKYVSIYACSRGRCRTFKRRPLQAFFSMAVLIRRGLVTVKSSPTIWMLLLLVKCDHASQSSWSKGSSIETMGYFSMYPRYRSASSLPEIHLVGSELGFLKSRSYLPSL